ncbi:unnamed protein product [Cercospora beticola]|nr:unnamed protein product [Cercospora beticola]
MRSYLTEKGYVDALEQDNLEASTIAKALAAIRLGVEDGPSSRKFGSSSKATTKQRSKSPKRLTKKGSKDASKYCSYCKKEGHLEDDCYREEIDLLYALVEDPTRCFSIKERYIIDSPLEEARASRIENLEGEAIGNSGTITSYGVGNVRIRFKDTNKVAILTNCLYTPEFRLNLVSLSQLDSRSVYARLKNGVIELFNSQDDLLTKAILNKSLYKLNISIPTPSYSKEYKRLEYIGDNTLKRLGVSAENKEISPTYEVYISSKHTRKISRTITEKAKSYLDKVACDICGPIEPPTNRGYRYFISFIDNYTRYIEANLISRKSKAFSCFRDFKLRAENSDSNSSNKRPRLKVLKSDNAKELVSSKVETLLKNSGVKHELSSPYNPEQNGLIERPNRTLLGEIRALLLESGLPKTFWGEALEAAVFLYNRTPHSSLGFKSPYELRYNKPPNLDNIRIFGSIAYYTRVKAKKLDTRAKKAILIEYSDSNIYKLYNLESRRPSKDKETPLESTTSLKNSRSSSDLVQASSSSKSQISLDTPNNLLDSSSRNDDSRSSPTSSNTLEGDELVDDLETVSKAPKTTIGDITSSRPIRTLEDDSFLSLYALIASNNSDDPTSYSKAINSPNKDD